MLARLEHLIEQSKRNKNTFALLYIDVDKFKTINDTKGHAFGDQVLIETASRLKQLIRNADTVARIGGDEFVVLLAEITHKNSISRMLENLAKAFNKSFMINDAIFTVGCSVGVAISPDEATTTNTLLAKADKNMYKTKYKLSDAE